MQPQAALNKLGDMLSTVKLRGVKEQKLNSQENTVLMVLFPTLTTPDFK